MLSIGWNARKTRITIALASRISIVCTMRGFTLTNSSSTVHLNLCNSLLEAFINIHTVGSAVLRGMSGCTSSTSPASLPYMLFLPVPHSPRQTPTDRGVSPWGKRWYRASQVQLLESISVSVSQLCVPLTIVSGAIAIKIRIPVQCAASFFAFPSCNIWYTLSYECYKVELFGTQ